jgi:hypothetical protein
VINLYWGAPAEPDKWSQVWWVSYKGSPAMRQSAVDHKWYLTMGYVQDTVVVFGPAESREALEMLIVTGALDDYIR